jgi:tartrate dehydrogenase/decarboxylase/D-malate dehydrogenase
LTGAGSTEPSGGVLPPGSDPSTYSIALLPGDGVGVEVIDQARRAVEALAIPVRWTELPWGCSHYAEHGSMMDAGWEDELRAHDAVLMGACGWPSVPDHVSLWGMTLAIRQKLDLWANVRPARLLPGSPTPLEGRRPDEIDMLFLRENTEGEYAGIGGRSHHGLPLEVAIETSVFTRTATERIVRYAFELAAARRKLLTSATKSNASRYGYVLWDEVVEETAADFPEVRVERVLVDALAARTIRDPASLDVMVASNLFGDILTDLAAAITGGLGMAASANIAPGSDAPGVFESVHGSAPDIAGKGLANPVAAVWSASLMLQHLGETQAAARLMAAIEAVCAEGPRTPDVGGASTTSQVGDAIVAALAT